jgi:hypothetical protein
MKTVVVLRSAQMGEGDSQLGLRILGAFLRKSAALPGLEALVLYNAGVKLLAPGSPLLADLRQVEEAGVDLLACGTCVAHYGLEATVGTVTDMDTILRELAAAEKVITL